jgi:predicted O-methyltransferase YrrM
VPPLDAQRLERHADEMVELARGLAGYLTAREVRFLSLLGAVPTARGEVLEIGSFKGKSTVVLARSAALAGESRIVAVDPLTLPSPTDPGVDPAGVPDAFHRTLESHGVGERVEFHQMPSARLAASWARPLRLLWIDGDHTRAGARADFDGFAGHLAPGSIVAVHDVLHRFEGPLSLVCEAMVLSSGFGPCGVCGSIGWAQYLGDEAAVRPYWPRKRRLHRALARLIPHVREGRPAGAWDRVAFQVKRALVPHGDMSAERWLREVRLSGNRGK